MRVTALKLANLRAIETAEFHFQPGFNLIVGVNGVGKTTMLDALRVCLSAFAKQANELRAPVESFTVDDIRVPAYLRIVEPTPKQRYVTCVPLVPLKIAAGAFSDPQHVDDEGFEWVAFDTGHRLRPGMFVAQVVGKSMEPAIPDGAYCLFRAPVEGTRQGKTVLVQLRDTTDPETSQRYTVKRYESEKANDGDSWHHTKITLKPVNPAFDPIVLTGAVEGEFKVVAELVEVLPKKT